MQTRENLKFKLLAGWMLKLMNKRIPRRIDEIWRKKTFFPFHDEIIPQ